MPYYLAPQTFKRQAKTLVQHWPFGAIKTTHARDLLSQLYGYDNNHHYQKLSTEAATSLLPIDADTVLSHYTVWVKKLADLGSMNQTQARQLLHHLWPSYLSGQINLREKLYTAQFRFHGPCTDFLDDEWQNAPFTYHFDDRPALKDAVEAIGVPHPEVGALRVNGHWTGFDYLLMNNDQVEVYANPYPSSPQLLPYKPQTLTFLLDVHLSSLARYLRMAGFDCLHENKDYGDALLAEVAAQNDYILLTRDIGLLKRSKVKYGHWVRNVLPELQFREIVQHYQLHEEFAPFSRCIKCNGLIAVVAKQDIQALVPERVFMELDDFRQCQQCRQVYWKGSHYDKIVQILADARA